MTDSVSQAWQCLNHGRQCNGQAAYPLDHGSVHFYKQKTEVLAKL